MKFTTSTVLALALALQNAAGRVVERAATSTSANTITTTVTSTSSSAATATPVKNTGKRGLCYNQANLTMPFSLSGQDSQVSWAYNWGLAESSSDFNPALEYVPMLWSNAPELLSQWNTSAQAAIDAGSTALLGFNEPDWCVSGSACMSINDSVSTWQQYMEPFAGKALLGSPAVTNVGAPYGLTWLENFIGNCTNCTIDFVTIHWYSNKWAGATYFKSQVEAARAIAGGRPIWITEFGLDDSDGTYTDDDLHAFLEEVMPWMDEQDDVHRYAYFMNTPGMLIDATGDGMSDTGAMYNNYAETSSSAAATSTPTIQLLSAYFADANVMAAVRTTFLNSNTLTINTNDLLSAFGISDPWWGTLKTLSVLYSYNNTTCVFTTAEQTGTYTITPSSLSSSAQVPGYPRMMSVTVDLIGMTRGAVQIMTESVWEQLDSQQATGWGFQLTTDLFGVDGLWGHEQSAVIWYKESGVLKALAGRENGWVQF